jgi:hypothetical protein
MTNEQHGRLLEQLVRLNEQTKIGMGSLKGLYLKLEEINGELAEMNRTIGRLMADSLPAHAVILRGLVARGTITEADAQVAMGNAAPGEGGKGTNHGTL